MNLVNANQVVKDNDALLDAVVGLNSDSSQTGRVIKLTIHPILEANNEWLVLVTVKRDSLQSAGLWADSVDVFYKTWNILSK